MERYLKQAPADLVSRYKQLKSRKGDRWKKIKKVFTNLDIPERIEYDGQIYEIWDDLLILTLFDVYFIVDDSPSTTHKFDEGLHESANNLVKGRRRKDYIKELTEVMIDITRVLDDDGLTIHFLNNGKFSNVRDYSEVDEIFGRKKTGHTPLTHVFQEANNSVVKIREGGKTKTKPILVIITTDGEPTKKDHVAKRKTGGSLVSDKDAFVEALQKRSSNVYVSIVVCTDKDGRNSKGEIDDSIENEVAYLEDLDDDDTRLNVMGLYHHEVVRSREARRENIGLSLGMYLALAALGPLDHKYDSINEPDELNTDYELDGSTSDVGSTSTIGSEGSASSD